MANPRKGWAERFDSRFGVGRYHYSLTPWIWDTTSMPMHHWRGPASAVGLVDFRSIPQQSIAGGAPQGFAFCASTQPTGGIEIAHSLNFINEQATNGMRDAWESGMGFRPIGGPNIVDLPWDQLTTGSDPSGENGPKPLMPGTDGFLRFYIGGHSLAKSEYFRWGIHPHTNRVRDVLRRQFAEQHERHQEHARKVLDFWCIKYRVEDWKEFVPANLHAHVPGRLKHSTTITETFTGTDGDPLGPNHTWTIQAGTWVKKDNKARKSTNDATVEMARADTALSSDDHYAQVVVTVGISRFHGPVCRVPSSIASTGYLVAEFSVVLYLRKQVAGVFTDIDSVAHTIINGGVYKVEADGSAIKGYADTVGLLSATDTAITGNLYCGLVAYGAEAGGTMDNFEAADLGAGSDTGSGAVSLQFDASAVSASDATGSGTVSLSMTVVGEGKADATTDGATTLSFLANAVSQAEAISNGSALFSFDATAIPFGGDVTDGAAEFSIIAAAVGASDATGSGSALIGFSAAAEGKADAAGAGLVSLSFTALGVLMVDAVTRGVSAFSFDVQSSEAIALTPDRDFTVAFWSGLDLTVDFRNTDYDLIIDFKG